MINYQTRQKIVAQAINEIQWDRQYKQGKTTNWRLNEQLYYGKKQSQDTSRANIDLGRMQEFVHTLLSKIDDPLIFKFLKRKLSHLKRVARLNALRVSDQQEDNWEIKDLAGKKQGIIYGRAIYSYFADSANGYKPNLENVDVYDFLIDPAAGGLDIEKAMHLGRYNVIKYRSELEAGSKSGLYLKTETRTLLTGDGNSTEVTQEETNKIQRTTDTNVTSTEKDIGNVDKFVFWEWYTTYEGERYYLLLNETGACAVRIEPLPNLFKSNLWPFWTWAAFLDLTEFWTPSYCDYVRDIFMAQTISVNQVYDNSEQRNKPQRVVNISAVKKLSQLKYQRGGNYIEVDGDKPVQDYIQTLEVPEISTALKVYDLLEGIQEKASGVTAGAKGEADTGGRATIYEGNQAAAADRFGLLNRSYSFGYKRFSVLWQWGVKEHLTKKKAIDIIGPDGVEMENISKNDIFKKDEEFGVLIEASSAETSQSELEKRTKIQFLAAQAVNPVQNGKKAYEVGASIAGFDDDTIRQLLDTSEFGDAEVMSQADTDIEEILEGNIIDPYYGANPAYKQRFIDFMNDNFSDLDDMQKTNLLGYMDQLTPIIAKNLARVMAMQGAQPPMQAPSPDQQQPQDQQQPLPASPVADPTASISQIQPQGI